MIQRKRRTLASLCLLALVGLLAVVEFRFVSISKKKINVNRRLELPVSHVLNDAKINDDTESQNVINHAIINNTKESQHVISDARINVIIAYMRTGSSFVGGTLKTYPNTFYSYEPIRDIWEEFWYDKQPVTPVLYPNGTTIYHKLQDRSRVVLHEILNFMTCNFVNLSMITLIARKRPVSELEEKIMLFDLIMCTRNHEEYVNKSRSLLEIKTWTQCLEKMRSRCLKASVRLMKFIRIPLSEIRKLLSYFPNLKVLHLNRDPRGIFNSRKYLKWTPQKATNKEVIEHCKDWLNDVEEVKEFATENPDRFRVVRYEDVAKNVTKYFRSISTFFEMDFEPEMKAYLINITTAEKDGSRWELNREDPYRTATKWRKDLAYSRAKFISRVCKKGMKRMNYYQFTKARDMRNLKFDDRGAYNLLNAI